MPDLAGALPAEQQAIHARCVHPTGPFVEFGKGETEGSIPERFEQMVAGHRDRLAVTTRSHAWTYEALNAAANRIAWAILRRRGEGPEPVALLLEDGAPMIAAILGVLKAGKMFVVLAPTLPPARLAQILADAQAGLLVTGGRHLSLAGAGAAGAGPALDINGLDAGGDPGSPGLVIAPDQLAYMVYTSGSTGGPKGVLQTHRNGLHEAMLYVNTLRVSTEDRLALLYSCSASQGLKIAFAALLGGATLCPFDVKEEGVGRLTPWLAREGITMYFSVPVLFRQWTSTLTGPLACPTLRVVQLGSDLVTRSEVEAYRAHCSPSTVLVVRLGSTETGTLRTCFFDHRAPRVDNLVPVGHAVQDMDVALLDESGQPVEGSGVGEIVVSSRYVSPGYWRQPELTRERFRPDPARPGTVTFRTGDLGRMGPDGCLFHLGRQDFQVKVRGHRIEVAEIETTLLGHPAVRAAVVATWEPQPGEPRLVAYLVPRTRPAPPVSGLQGYLRDRLPDYMVPAAFVLMDELPLTPGGKIDRRALAGPGSARPELLIAFGAPRNPVQEAVAAAWAEVLGLDQVGIHDGFLELGGDSLAAARVVSRLLDRFGIELSASALLEGATVASMATAVDRHLARPESGERSTG